MRTRNVVALLVAAVVVAQVAPAFGAPSLDSLIRRVDAREKRHYRELDSRIKASVLLTLRQSIKTTLVTGTVTQSKENPRFFFGSAGCGSSTTLVSGGVDWGTPPNYFGDWHIIESGPGVGGTSWKVTLNIGDSPRPPKNPVVYAVCARI